MTDDRSNADVERATIVAERAGVLALARSYCGAVDAAVTKAKIDAGEATALKSWAKAFADMIATGLHRVDADPVGVRAALHAILEGEAA